ncbi:MAG: MaoC family dehydratase [Desulfobacteraceae bacterium]|nr:MaoC family dehydratase [Desulfobacteraceae bacterium]
MIGKSINELEIGNWAEFTKTISESDVYTFAGITGDLNPAHIDKEYAKQTIFKERIAHGILLAGFISTVIGTKLPGPGTIYMGQDLKFLAPVLFGDTVKARVEIIEIDKVKNRISLKTTCTKQDGTMVLTGTALVLPPRMEKT